MTKLLLALSVLLNLTLSLWIVRDEKRLKVYEDLFGVKLSWAVFEKKLMEQPHG